MPYSVLFHPHGYIELNQYLEEAIANFPFRFENGNSFGFISEPADDVPITMDCVRLSAISMQKMITLILRLHHIYAYDVIVIQSNSRRSC